MQKSCDPDYDSKTVAKEPNCLGKGLVWEGLNKPFVQDINF